MNAERTLLLPLEGDLPDAHLRTLAARVAGLRGAALDSVLLLSPQTMQAASLPLAVEVEHFTSNERLLQRPGIERAMARREREVQLFLAECSRQHALSVRCSRHLGDIAEVVAARPGADVLLLPTLAYSALPRLARKAGHLEELVLYCDAGAGDFLQEVLPLVQRLCAEHGVEQLTLLHEGSVANAADALLSLRLPLRRWLVNTRDAQWVRRLHLGAGSLLLLPLGVPGTSGAPAVVRLLRNARGPVLLLQ